MEFTRIRTYDLGKKANDSMDENKRFRFIITIITTRTTIISITTITSTITRTTAKITTITTIYTTLITTTTMTTTTITIASTTTTVPPFQETWTASEEARCEISKETRVVREAVDQF
jgi:hypothetical protein